MCLAITKQVNQRKKMMKEKILKRKAIMQKEKQNKSRAGDRFGFLTIGKFNFCGKQGHQSTTCKHKNKPTEERAINKIQ
jgi:hypothetical protein